MPLVLCDERRRLLETGGNILVRGGAGSGKTTISLAKASVDIVASALGRDGKALFLSFARATVARVDRKIYTPTHGVRNEPPLRCKITFEDGARRELDFSIIKDLEPYEVLIGCDLMSEMKLDVNFKTGVWTLDWA